jgi:hypothetical protein
MIGQTPPGKNEESERRWEKSGSEGEFSNSEGKGIGKASRCGRMGKKQGFFHQEIRNSQKGSNYTHYK